jgi:hypothetical protein
MAPRPSFLLVVLLASAPADAQEEPVPADFPRLLLDSGRPVVSPPEPDLVRLQLHGEYQLRYQFVRPFPLDVTPTTANDKPGAIEDSTGQSQFLWHWLRLTPRLQLRDRFQIVAQMDVLTGMVVGERAHGTFADETPRDEYNGFSNVQPRWLYADLDTSVGVFRVGQQPNHWGMGLVFNDGDHPSLFGDYRYGSIVERLLYAAKPAGKDSPLTLLVAGDLVYRDREADLSRDQQAFQGVVAAAYGEGPNEVGLYGVYRNQKNHRDTTSYAAFSETLEQGTLDATARFAVPVVGNPDTFVFGQAEAALALGSKDTTNIASYGAAAILGVMRKRGDYGEVVAQVEAGYASGDADPYDDTDRRFVFDPNHRVGLLLFDEVMRFQTARAASAAQDPLLTNAGRPTPGLPSNGGVFGAQYINPTVVVRPRRWLDLKGGVLLAQATADVVDPYRVGTQGAYVNYRGGDARRHDLGVEFDVGAEARVPLDYKMMLTLGAQGAVLLPGRALANAAGEAMNTPWLTIGRIGILF